jgi:hypothetical protein
MSPPTCAHTVDVFRPHGQDRQEDDMHDDAPLELVAASYASSDHAVQDFEAVWGGRHDGGFHHTAIALVTRNADGRLEVGRNNSTAKHLEWGGGLLGGALFVVAPAAGSELLARVGLSGAGAIIGHIRQNADPGALVAAADVLERDTTGLVVVLVNHRGEGITSLLAHAAHRSCVHMVWGDLEEELAHDFSRPRSRLLVAI